MLSDPLHIPVQFVFHYFVTEDVHDDFLLPYECTIKSLEKFFKSYRITFFDVTVNSLNDYEKWMLKPGNSITTVGIYLRNLRAVVNAAIMDGTIPKEVYPFGKHRYTIPAKSNVKKALNRNQVQLIFNYKPVSSSCSKLQLDDFLSEG